MSGTSVNLAIAFAVALPSIAVVVGIYVTDKGMRGPAKPVSAPENKLF